MTFVDVAEDHWAYEEISIAAYYGWVNGLGEGRFGPSMEVTRTQAAALVNRMLGRIPDKEAIDAGYATVFEDVSRDHWGWYHIGEATTTHDYSHNEDRTVETWK